MSRPITFRHIQAGRFRNTETGIEIQGMKRTWSVVLPDREPTPWYQAANGLIHVEAYFDDARRWARDYITRIARPALAEAHAEALEMDAAREVSL